MQTDNSDIRILFMGVDQPIVDFVQTAVQSCVAKIMRTTDEFLSLLESPEIETFQIIIAGPGIEGVSILEVAQSIRGVHKRAPFFYAHSTRDFGYDSKEFQKNGFSQAFLFPFDKEVLKDALEKVISQIKSLPVFRPVKIVDIGPEQNLDFDVHIYLPVNSKYIHYSSAGRNIEASRVERLKTYQVGSVFIPLNQMDKFYEYSAEKLKKLCGNDAGLSETEKKERLQSAVRDLMSGIFSSSNEVGFADGRKMLEDTNQIIKSYVMKKYCGDLYRQILSALCDTGGSYSHLANVSTFAALFSMATGIGEPEELALAGMFHDIGLSMVPGEIQAKALDTLSEEELKIYQRHPEHTIDLIKGKKLTVSDKIQTMILQHHERINSSGYPLGITEPKLKIESQILALADEFDELTKVEAGRPTLSPLAALEHLRQRGDFKSSLIDQVLSAFN